MNTVINDSVEELESSLERLFQRKQRMHGMISSPFVATEQRLDARRELDSLQEKIEQLEFKLERLQCESSGSL